MANTMLKTLVSVESTPLPSAPAQVVSRSHPGASSHAVDSIELQSVRQWQHSHGQPIVSTKIADPRPIGNADASEDIERRDTATESSPADAFTALPGLTDPPMNKYRLISCCLISFVAGMTDSAPGALIPYMETYYDIGYAVVSLVFVGNALGFILAAPLVETLRERLGRAKALGFAMIMVGLGYLPMVCVAPFPTIIIGYFFFGFGSALALAMNNAFCANLRDGTTMLGLMHGSYGAGGTVGPLIATALVTQANAVWGWYYLLTFGFAVVNCFFVTWAFWGYESEGNNRADVALNEQGGQPRGRQQLAAMFSAFKLKVAMLGAIFIFAYQGAEVSISGWVISFLIATRDGDPSAVGYVTSGFWAGITIGRFVLSPIGSRVGEKLFVYLLAAGATVFQLLVWFVPNIIAESVSLAIVGLLLGPVYPCSAAVFARNLSRKQQVSGISVISAFGSSGGALAPFTTGLLAQAAGTFVLHPIVIGLYGLMVITWYGQPTPRKRSE